MASFALVLLLSACAQPAHLSSPDEITVEGMVTVRGNEPFTAMVLETPQRNFYVLEIENLKRGQMVNPARYRVTGTLYRGSWNGRPYAHIRVARFERITTP